LAQDAIRKGLISHANMMQKPLEQGVDYYGNDAMQAMFAETPTCPDTGGSYTAVLAPNGRDVIIRCNDHGAEHHK